LPGDWIEREGGRGREIERWWLGDQEERERLLAAAGWLLRWCWWKLLGQHLRRKEVMGQQITAHHVMFCSLSLFFLISTFYFLNKSKELCFYR
jgi:hypothetical protein